MGWIRILILVSGILGLVNNLENAQTGCMSFFDDVSCDHWVYDYIGLIKEAGITKGCGPSLDCPDDFVTREQMAAFLVRAIYGENFRFSSLSYFNDVDVKDHVNSTPLGSYYFPPLGGE